MFLWFNSNNKCNSNGKVIVIVLEVIVIGCLNVSSNSNSNSNIFPCNCKHNRSNTSHICLGENGQFILLTINNYVINLCINISKKQR